MALKFSDQLKRFSVKVEGRTRGVFVGTAAKMHRSIVEGSGVTGAPGQPVDTGYLRGSWKLAVHRDYAEIHTNVSYAPVIEYDLPSAFDPAGQDRPENLKGQSAPNIPSEVGGAHSVALTIAGASHLQAWALRELGP